MQYASNEFANITFGYISVPVIISCCPSATKATIAIFVGSRATPFISAGIVQVNWSAYKLPGVKVLIGTPH